LLLKFGPLLCISKSIDFVVVDINVPIGFLDFFENILEKRDLSVTDCVSVFERERTRRVKDCFSADDGAVEFVFVNWDFPVGNPNEATGIAAFVCRPRAATTFGCSASSVVLLLAALPPPGPEVLFVVWENTPTESVNTVLVFFSFVLLRDENTACIRARFDESLFVFLDDCDRSISVWSILPPAEFASF
jgi:hypothetical protein